MWKVKKNGFLAKIAWHHLCQEGRKNAHFRAHYLFWPMFFLDQNSVKQEKLYKNRGFSGNCPKPKMTPFLWKRCFFDMVEKVGFTNCVFEKLCFPENTIFIVFSAKHSFSKTKTVCWKNRKFMKNSGLFLKHGKMVFFGGVCFLEVLILKVCFWCVWYCFKSVKNACFSQFWFFFWGGSLLFIWVWKV